MLVRLYDLPDSSALYREVEAKGVILRRARAFEKHTVADFVRTHFSMKWVSEVEVAITRQPSACFIATRDKSPKPIGSSAQGGMGLPEAGRAFKPIRLAPAK